MSWLGGDRQGGDGQLVARLRACGFKGAEWDRVAERLVAYGLAKLTPQIRYGTIFMICYVRKIRPKLPRSEQRPFLREQDIRDLTCFTLEEAVLAFPDALQPGRWSAKGGASLTTWFLGQCYIQFPEVYLDWLRHDRPQAGCDSLTRPDGTVTDVPDPSDPIQVSIDHVDACHHLGKLDDRTRLVLIYLGAGYSPQETSDLLGITKKATEGLLYRYRRRVAAEGGSA